MNRVTLLQNIPLDEKLIGTRIDPGVDLPNGYELLSCEELGFFIKLRLYSWKNMGIPNDQALLTTLAGVCRLSRYKLDLLWPLLKGFFNELNGVFYYGPDESKRGSL